MNPETKLARDLAVMLAGGLFLASGFGFGQRWVLESRDGVAAPPATITFREKRRRQDEVTVVTACNTYDAAYSRFLGQMTIETLSHVPRDCVDQDRPLLDALERTRRYHFEGETLLLETSDGHSLVLRHAA